MKKASRVRLDDLLVERGCARDRRAAAALILAGQVRLDGVGREPKAGLLVAPTIVLRVVAPARRFVSRGGDKLDHALDQFGVDVEGRVALDVGASTGGFTHCLLSRGAARVYAVDVGRGLLHDTLRRDTRVVVLESCNARSLGRALVPEPIDIATADVSFISLKAILPAVAALLAPRAWVVLLVKPQFEAARHEVERGGVVRSEAVRARVVRETEESLRSLRLDVAGSCDSPVRGPKGNREVLLISRAR